MTMLNGYRILSSVRCEPKEGLRPASVILGKRADGEFVTALLCDGDDQWSWGHYFEDESEALADFRARARRGF